MNHKNITLNMPVYNVKYRQNLTKKNLHNKDIVKVSKTAYADEPLMTSLTFKGNIAKVSAFLPDVRKLFSHKKAEAIASSVMGEAAKKLKVRGTDIDAITSDEEYVKLLEKLKQSKHWKSAWEPKDSNVYEQGLMPYVGHCDIHGYINTFLRKFDPNIHDEHLDFFLAPYPPEVLRDYIQLLDYALKKLDDKFGVYSGTVYRYGLITDWLIDGIATQKGYLSTSQTVDALVDMGVKHPLCEQPFNIIQIKKGHKVIDAQKGIKYDGKYSKQNYVYEEEILMDPGARFELLNELTPEMERLKQEFETKLGRELDCNLHNKSMYRLYFWREV